MRKNKYYNYIFIVVISLLFTLIFVSRIRQLLITPDGVMYLKFAEFLSGFNKDPRLINNFLKNWQPLYSILISFFIIIFKINSLSAAYITSIILYFTFILTYNFFILVVQKQINIFNFIILDSILTLSYFFRPFLFVLSEQLFSLLLLIFIFFLYEFYNSKKYFYIFLLGFITGFSILTRYVGYFLILTTPLIIIFILKEEKFLKKIVHLAVYFVTSFVPLIPWIAYLYQKKGNILLTGGHKLQITSFSSLDLERLLKTLSFYLSPGINNIFFIFFIIFLYLLLFYFLYYKDLHLFKFSLILFFYIISYLIIYIFLMYFLNADPNARLLSPAYIFFLISLIFISLSLKYKYINFLGLLFFFVTLISTYLFNKNYILWYKTNKQNYIFLYDNKFQNYINKLSNYNDIFISNYPYYVTFVNDKIPSTYLKIKDLNILNKDVTLGKVSIVYFLFKKTDSLKNSYKQLINSFPKDYIFNYNNKAIIISSPSFLKKLNSGTNKILSNKRLYTNNPRLAKRNIIYSLKYYLRLKYSYDLKIGKDIGVFFMDSMINNNNIISQHLILINFNE